MPRKRHIAFYVDRWTRLSVKSYRPIATADVTHSANQRRPARPGRIAPRGASLKPYSTFLKPVSIIKGYRLESSTVPNLAESGARIAYRRAEARAHISDDPAYRSIKAVGAGRAGWRANKPNGIAQPSNYMNRVDLHNADCVYTRFKARDLTMK
ncbi:hypothetical protein EVAR_30042_1 [Eumeta japonica]|uniref:Uncharacterized protein n=1 Tax=Eumeta variegata TaxID=151549 RepID=A0A4C1VW31_EUMVA|nr:hypothetical protein EVAR_30042_1 [Eumeta japonica]